jgi:pyruvate dehydrogenase E2 component (dihydrolipoamide acetyltransferase)
MADHTQAPARGKGEVTVKDPARWQAAVARRSAETRAIVPDLDFAVEIDAEPLTERARGLEGGITTVLVRACALALRENPQANGAYRDGRFECYGRVNVGFVVATPEIYTMPTVFDADEKTREQIGCEVADLTERAVSGTLSPPDGSGATFTLSDMGPLGVTSSTPVIVPPQAAAVAAGVVREVPVVRNGAIVPGKAMTLTLATDHRVLYGAAAGAFLAAIKTRLEEASP